MSRPNADLRGAAEGWIELDRTLSRLTDERAREPSALPGWTRAHVVAHIWGNGEGFAGAVSAAALGRVGQQYPGGTEQRARDIEGRASLPIDVIVEGAREAHHALVDAWGRMPDDGWDQPIEFVTGIQPVRVSARGRWREIVVHHVDLDVGFGPADLPVDYRADDAAWLTEFRPDW
ncbi:MAG: maleylpyruvate isomerase N-terminal domain-containing protein [Acidimicrobiia bacterium]